MEETWGCFGVNAAFFFQDQTKRQTKLSAILVPIAATEIWRYFMSFKKKQFL